MTIYTIPDGKNTIQDGSSSYTSLYSSQKIEDKLDTKADKDLSGDTGDILVRDGTGQPVSSGKQASDFADASHTHPSSAILLSTANFGGVLDGTVTTLQEFADYIDDNLSLGANIEIGSGTPSNSLGKNGDIYIDILTGTIYSKASEVYTNSGTLPQLQGETGANPEFQSIGQDLQYRLVGDTVWTTIYTFPTTADVSYNDLTDVPTNFTPSTHTHSYSNITDIPTTFTPEAHTHTFESTTNKPTTLSGYGITDAVNDTQLDANDRTYITDTRGTNHPPSYYDDRYSQWDFTDSTDILIPGETDWCALNTISMWSSYNDTHRQHQIAYTSGKQFIRIATSDSAWGDWTEITDKYTQEEADDRFLIKRTIVPYNDDLDNYSEIGYYYQGANAGAITIANTPVDLAFHLEVVNMSADGAGSVMQRFTEYDQATPKQYMRTRYYGTWGSWHQMPDPFSDQSFAGEKTFTEDTTFNGNIKMSGTANILELTADGKVWNIVNGSDVFTIRENDTSGTSTRFRINAGGNVGIGANAPDSKLNIYENNATSDNTNGVTIEQDGTGDALLQFLLTGVRRYVMGIDNSYGDRFRISTGTTGFNSNILLEIDPADGSIIAPLMSVADIVNDKCLTTKEYVDANSGSYPKEVYTSGEISLSDDFNASITHSLGVTEADVEKGKYSIRYYGKQNGANGVDRNSIRSTYYEENAWSTVSGTNTSNTWQANTVSIKNDSGDNFTEMRVRIFQNWA